MLWVVGGGGGEREQADMGNLGQGADSGRGLLGERSHSCPETVGAASAGFCCHGDEYQELERNWSTTQKLKEQICFKISLRMGEFKLNGPGLGNQETRRRMLDLGC